MFHGKKVLPYKNILSLRKYVSNVLLHGPNKELQDWNGWHDSSYSVRALKIMAGQCQGSYLLSWHSDQRLLVYLQCVFFLWNYVSQDYM